MRAPTASVILRPITNSNLSLYFHSRFSLLVLCDSEVTKYVSRSGKNFVTLTRLQHQWGKYSKRISDKNNVFSFEFQQLY
jgi:hypothetical protein